MQIRIIVAIAIFLGSYLPLSVILLVQDLQSDVLKACVSSLISTSALQCDGLLKNPTSSLSAVAICTAGGLLTLAAFRLLPAGRAVHVVESKHVPADLINYVIPYVVSFMSLDYDQAPKMLGFVVFLGWIFWITYKSGQIALNPVLTVLGWQLYEIKYTFTAGKAVHVGRMLSKTAVSAERSYRQNGLQDVMIAKEEIGGGAE